MLLTSGDLNEVGTRGDTDTAARPPVSAALPEMAGAAAAPREGILQPKPDAMPGPNSGSGRRSQL